MSEEYSVKWNDFCANVSKSYGKLRDEDDFCDVTLVSDDQRQISAHKVVLSAASEYFKCVLKANKHPNPLLCLEGISYSEIESVLDYAYHGEVSICQNDLDRFLAIAERFKLEGLSADENNSQAIDLNPVTLVEVKHEVIDEDFNIETENQVIESEDPVSKDEKMKIFVSPNEISNMEELDAKLLQYIDKDGKKWKCNICGKISKDKTAAKEHVEVHCEGLSFSCPEPGCGSKLKSRQVLRSHTLRFHRK